MPCNQRENIQKMHDYKAASVTNEQRAVGGLR